MQAYSSRVAGKNACYETCFAAMRLATLVTSVLVFLRVRPHQPGVLTVNCELICTCNATVPN